MIFYPKPRNYVDHYLLGAHTVGGDELLAEQETCVDTRSPHVCPSCGRRRPKGLAAWCNLSGAAAYFEALAVARSVSNLRAVRTR